ncbi:hypothetical protein [Herbiconiux sp. YIM B11900]|uniref:hypothetical protein n=1 Tax=Herbiconiux sp. YIM B11900 TaxID=3404131 RepID=UPI003F86108D
MTRPLRDDGHGEARLRPDRESTAVSAVLLGFAGLLQLAAAAIRWAPCIAPSGSVSTAAASSPDPCSAASDHLRDYVWVSVPFEPIPGAVVLAGIASLLLVVFWVIQTVHLRRHRILLVLSAVTAATWLFAAATQLPAAFSGGVLGVVDDRSGLAALVVLTVAAVAPLVVALRSAVMAVRDPAGVMVVRDPAGGQSRRGRGRGAEAAGWLLVAVAAVLAFPLVDYVLLNPFTGTHDSPVGSAAPAALALLAAAAAFVAAFVAARSRRVRSVVAQAN